MKTTNYPAYIVLHHSASKDGTALNMQALRAMHLERGWKDIAYHFIIEQINGRQEIVMGRYPNQYGAHSGVTVINATSVGVCLVGNFMETEPPAEQWERAVRLCSYLSKQYKISLGNIRGHREFKPTLCPGDKFDMEKFRAAVEKELIE